MCGALVGCALVDGVLAGFVLFSTPERRRRGRRTNISLGASAAKSCPSRIALPFDDICGDDSRGRGALFRWGNGGSGGEGNNAKHTVGF